MNPDPDRLPQLEIARRMPSPNESVAHLSEEEIHRLFLERVERCPNREW